MSCVRTKCEYRVDRNGDQRDHGTFCSHPADTVNRYDGQPQCPYHEDAVDLTTYERRKNQPPEPIYAQEEDYDTDDFPYT